MRKILVGIGLVLVIAIVVLLVVPLPGTGEAQSASNTVRTSQIERTTLYDTVEGSGSVTAEQVSSLSFEVAGTVTDVLVEMGDEITEGQVLATLDTGDLEYDVELAEMSLQIQQSDYDEATSPATEEEIAQAEAQLAQANSSLESAQDDLDNIEDQRLTSCSSLDTAEETLAEAQTAYDDYVTAGYNEDPTFVPDPDSTEAKALTSAQSNYDKAEAQCTLSTSNLGSTTALDVAQANYDQAEASYEDVINGPSETQLLQAEVQLQQAQLQLQQAQDALAAATLVAPYDGIVTAVNIVVGQEVTASSAAITVADTSQLHIDVSVDELDVINVEPGLQANITLQALDDTVVTGSVRQIAPSGRPARGW
jgi:HlyD family secretion protein